MVAINNGVEGVSVCNSPPASLAKLSPSLEREGVSRYCGTGGELKDGSYN